MAFLSPPIKSLGPLQQPPPSAALAPNPFASTTPASNSPFAPAKDRALGSSVIGSDLTILGDRITVISQNRLQIDGDIRGDVTGKQITIGVDGSVIGTVSAEHVDVMGGVRGAIRARSVALHATCQVEGEILHQTLSVAEGANFDGHVRRPKDIAELVPNLDPNSYSSLVAYDPQT